MVFCRVKFCTLMNNYQYLAHFGYILSYHVPYFAEDNTNACLTLPYKKLINIVVDHIFGGRFK
jgi:hypothetical protein